MEIIFIVVGLGIGYGVMKFALWFIDWVEKKDDSTR